MKINLKQNDLLRALTFVSSVTEKKTTMPILANVLIQARSKNLTMTGSDLEVSILSSCPADVIKEGQVCVPSTQLLDVVRRLPSQDVSIFVNENGLMVIQSSKSQFKLNVVDAAEYPKIMEKSLFKTKTINTDHIKEGINKTFYAISVDELRPNLNGVCMLVENKDEKRILKMVATDGHRLSIFDQELKNDESIEIGKKIILPRKGINELKKILSETQQVQILVGFTDQAAVFDFDHTTLFMKQIPGEFPDYQMVLPKGERKKMVINRNGFSDALKRVSLLSDNKSKCVKLSIKPSSVFLKANSPELGEAEEEMSCEFNSSENLEIGFNARYLLDAISVLEGENIVFELDHDQAPGVFKLSQSDSFSGVIMPMRI